MIDSTNMSIKSFSAFDWKILCSKFPGIRVSKTSRGHPYFFWFNLRIEFVPYLEQIWVRNSLHKFFNAVVKDVPIGETNHDDFTFKKIIQTIDFLCWFFEREPDEFEFFGKFEFGLNVNVFPYEPIDIIDSYISLGNTRINQFYVDNPYYGKVQGKSIYLSEYRVKVYDKSKQSENSVQGILRIEICSEGVGKIKKILYKKQVTLKDLMEKNTFVKLSENLLVTYDNIMKLPLHQDDLPREFVLEMLAYSHPYMIKYDQKRMKRNEYVKHRTKYKSLMLNHTESATSCHNMVRAKLLEKSKLIIN